MYGKKRKDSFFGIHFDFHAMEGQVVPSVWQPDAYEEMLDAVKPDYVQCDTKGHAGFSSYPTKVGVRAAMRDDIDILRFMRDATAARNIALYGHHSGLYDQQVGKFHPDWCVVDVNGEIDHDHASVFGPFVDEYLLPQLRELAGDYKLDGAWLDGECWGTRVDYSHWAVDAYKAKYGVEPPRPSDNDYEKYREFCREGFKAYVKHYVDVIHAEFPDFQITSNWIWSAYMPEKETHEVDFLSGDYSSTNSVCSARYQGRVLEARNMVWDLMAWGHSAIPCSWTTRNRNTKELGQYCQEAAVTIAMGGAFAFFNIHYGFGGAIQQWAIPIWAKTAEFCRARQICFKSRITKEIGVLFPSDRNQPSNAGIFTGNPGSWNLAQWLDLLQDTQYSTKVVFEYQLAEDDLSEYKTIVIPPTANLSENAVNGLKKYVENGGKLLIDGPSAKHFDGWGGYASGAVTDILAFIDGGSALAGGETQGIALTPLDGHAVGAIYNDNIYDSAHTHAAVTTPLQNGRFCALAFNMALFYAKNRSTAIRRFLTSMLEGELGYKPTVRVTGSHFAELCVAKKNDGTLLVNLINVAGEHNVANVRSYDEIPPIGPLTVTIAPSIPVKKVIQIPEDKELAVTRQADGSVSVSVERLEIHTVLQIQ